jgi:predicted transcriptional regulator
MALITNKRTAGNLTFHPTKEALVAGKKSEIKEAAASGVCFYQVAESLCISASTLRKHLLKLDQSLLSNLLENSHKKKSVTRGWLKRDLVNKSLSRIRALARSGALLGDVCEELYISRTTLNKWLGLLEPQLLKQFFVNRKLLYNQPKKNSMANRVRCVSIQKVRNLVSRGFGCSEIARKLQVEAIALSGYIKSINNKLHVTMINNGRMRGGDKRRKMGKVPIRRALILSAKGYSLRTIANITGYSFPSIVKYVKVNLGEKEYKRRHLDRAPYGTPFYNNRGDFLRSGYEAIVSDWLFKRGFEYETQSLLVLGKRRYRPDFKVLTSKGTVYLEVLGLLDKPEYRVKLTRKRTAYTRNKVVCIYILINDLSNLDVVLGHLRSRRSS